MSKQQDISQALQEQVLTAMNSLQPLQIRGSGSKTFYGYQGPENYLETGQHKGIINYQPTELVLTARAGTPLKEIEAALAKNGQMLACEPPHFGDKATFGGMIAAGLSGPQRPYCGSIEDLILGCTILNGKGEILRFGGKVMKNVAGYDHSRLMVGAMGCLGVILDATIKVLPMPNSTQTFRFAIEADKTLAFVNKLNSLGYPVSASAYDSSFNDIDKKCLLIRFCASENEISALKQMLTKDFSFLDFIEEAPVQEKIISKKLNTKVDYWFNLREQKSDFFSSGKNIWRISCAPNTPLLKIAGETLTQWNGALRWLKSDANPESIFDHGKKVGFSATLFKQVQYEQQLQQVQSPKSIFQPLPSALFHWHKQLKQAFDPEGILNPGRMYIGL